MRWRLPDSDALARDWLEVPEPAEFDACDWERFLLPSADDVRSDLLDFDCPAADRFAPDRPAPDCFDVDLRVGGFPERRDWRDADASAAELPVGAAPPACTTITPLHAGQRIFFPAADPGTANCFPHASH